MGKSALRRTLSLLVLVLVRQRRRQSRPGRTGRPVLARPLAGAAGGGGGGGGEGGAGLWQRGGAQGARLKPRATRDAATVRTQPEKSQNIVLGEAAPKERFPLTTQCACIIR